MFLKQIFAPRSEASRANMLVFRTSNFQGETIRPIVPRHKHSIVFIVHHYIFFRTLVQKSIRLQLNYFPCFETKAVKAKCKIWKRKQTKPHNTILIHFQLFIFYETRLFTEKFSRTTTIHPGIFGGRVLSIWVFSENGRYGLIVALRGWALSRHVINLRI